MAGAAVLARHPPRAHPEAIDLLLQHGFIFRADHEAAVWFHDLWAENAPGYRAAAAALENAGEVAAARVYDVVVLGTRPHCLRRPNLDRHNNLFLADLYTGLHALAEHRRARAA